MEVCILYVDMSIIEVANKKHQGSIAKQPHSDRAYPNFKNTSKQKDVNKVKKKKKRVQNIKLRLILYLDRKWLRTKISKQMVYTFIVGND